MLFVSLIAKVPYILYCETIGEDIKEMGSEKEISKVHHKAEEGLIPAIEKMMLYTLQHGQEKVAKSEKLPGEEETDWVVMETPSEKEVSEQIKGSIQRVALSC